MKKLFALLTVAGMMFSVSMTADIANSSANREIDQMEEQERKAQDGDDCKDGSCKPKLFATNDCKSCDCTGKKPADTDVNANETETTAPKA